MLCESNSLRTVADIRVVHGELDLHVVTYKDPCRVAVCFTRSADDFTLVLEYTTADSRGLLGFFLPLMSELVPRWMVGSVIRLSDDIQSPDVASTYFVGTVGIDIYYNYQRWILSGWLVQHPYFSLYESGSTPRKFIEQSLEYIVGGGTSKLLTLPVIRTYQLDPKDSELVSGGATSEVVMFYGGLSDLDRHEDVTYILSQTEVIYHYEPKLRRYWKYTQPRLVNVDRKIRVGKVAVDPPPLDPIVPPLVPIVPPLVPITPVDDRGQALGVIVLLVLLIIAFVIAVVIIYYLSRPVAVITPMITGVVTPVVTTPIVTTAPVVAVTT
jgi:hypothetical protein